MATENQTPPEGTIPVSQAMELTANWRLYLNANADANTYQVQSYLIPIVSLQNMLKYNPDAEAIRAYIGLEDVQDVMTTKLIFIPIVDGKEVPYKEIPSEKGTYGDDPCDTDDCSNIYDLTDPCPPLCPPPTGPPHCYLGGNF